MVSKSLRDRLIGAIDGSPSFFPMGTSPKGTIMYTPDGFMSAQLSKPDRKLFASGDWFKASDAGGTRHFRRGASSQLTCVPRGHALSRSSAAPKAALDPKVTGGRAIRAQVIRDHPIGSEVVFLQKLRISFGAASLFRLDWTRTSRTSPSASTGRQR
jgi:Lipocalin-like domain